MSLDQAARAAVRDANRGGSIEAVVLLAERGAPVRGLDPKRLVGERPTLIERAIRALRLPASWVVSPWFPPPHFITDPGHVHAPPPPPSDSDERDPWRPFGVRAPLDRRTAEGVTLWSSTDPAVVWPAFARWCALRALLAVGHPPWHADFLLWFRTGEGRPLEIGLRGPLPDGSAVALAVKAARYASDSLLEQSFEGPAVMAAQLSAKVRAQLAPTRVQHRIPRPAVLHPVLPVQAQRTGGCTFRGDPVANWFQDMTTDEVVIVTVPRLHPAEVAAQSDQAALLLAEAEEGKRTWDFTDEKGWTG